MVVAKIESTDYLLFFGAQTLGAAVTQDEETSLEQISRPKNSGTSWVSTLLAIFCSLYH